MTRRRRFRCLFTKATAVKTARWSSMPAIAGAALALAAGPALAEGTSIGTTTYSGYVSAGQLNVSGSGAYQCTTDTPYDYLEVSAAQQGPRRPGQLHRPGADACTGSTLTWQVTLTADQDDA